MKKILGLLLAVLLVLGMCPLGLAEGKPVVTIMSRWEEGALGGCPLDENAAAVVWQDACGADLDFLNVSTDTYMTKLSSMLASNSLNDITCLYSPTNGYKLMNEYGAKGMFVNISEHLDKMPNYAKFIEKYPEIKKIMTADDGNMYGLPYRIYDYADCMYYTALIREDLLAKIGKTLDDTLTLDGLTECLLALREYVPEGGAVWCQREGYTAFMKKVSYLFNTYNGMWWDYATNKYVFASESENFKNMLMWMNEMYKAGVIHPEWTTMSDPAWEALLASGKCLFTIDRLNICEDQNFDAAFDFRPILNPEVKGTRMLQQKAPNIDYSMPWVIAANSKNVDKCIEVLDYLYSEEAITMMQCGVEGTSYRVDPESKTAAYCGFDFYYYWAEGDLINQHYGFHGYEKFELVRNLLNVTKFNTGYPQIFVDFVNKVESGANGTGWAPAQPAVKFTSDEYKALTAYEIPLLTYLDEQVVLFVEGERSFDEWADFQAECQEMALAQVQAVYDAALARWNAI